MKSSGTQRRHHEVAIGLGALGVRLDVAALTDHATLFAIEGLSSGEWSTQATLANAANDPGQFTAIRGFEWSHPTHGHINIWNTTDFADLLRAGSPGSLYGWLTGRPGGLASFNHPGRELGRFNNFSFNAGARNQIVGLEMFNRTDDYLFEGWSSGMTSPLVACLNGGWRPGLLGAGGEHGTALAAQDDGARLDVPVHRALLVRGLQGAEHLEPDRGDPVRRERPPPPPHRAEAAGRPRLSPDPRPAVLLADDTAHRDRATQVRPRRHEHLESAQPGRAAERRAGVSGRRLSRHRAGRPLRRSPATGSAASSPRTRGTSAIPPTAPTPSPPRAGCRPACRGAWPWQRRRRSGVRFFSRSRMLI